MLLSGVVLGVVSLGLLIRFLVTPEPQAGDPMYHGGQRE